MKIEILYPEVGNLYGELANIKYLKQSDPELEIIETSLNETPRFLSGEEIGLVYMGTMTESAQEVVLGIWKEKGWKEPIRQAIERGQHFLITGNALELFGTGITDKEGTGVRNAEGTQVECMGLFHFHTVRDMMHRYNSLWIGKYGDMDIAAFKSQFTQSYYDEEIPHLFDTVRGPGFHPDIKEEGIHYKNFMATYLIGPIFVLDPPFMVSLMKELGVDVTPAYEEAAMDAYRFRLKEYSEPDRGFLY